jgi:hypothetical protein
MDGFWIALGPLLAGVASFGTFVVLPFLRRRRQRLAAEAVRAEQERIDSIFLHGDPGVADLIPVTLTARQRLAHVESALVTLLDWTRHADDTFRLLLESSTDTNHKVTGNGGDTNLLGDVVQRLAKQQDAWLDEPQPTLRERINATAAVATEEH